MKPAVALFLALVAGYVSLSQEILWYRIISYGTGGAPTVFAYLLASFLTGLAVGSLCAERVIKSTRLSPPVLLGSLFLASAVLGYFTIPSTARMFQHLQPLGINHGYLDYAYFSVALVGFPGGLLFPLLCHLSIRSGDEVGVPLSRLYLFNVLGSILGPLFTTFVLMDRYPLADIIRAVTMVSFAAAALAVFTLPASGRGRAGFLAAVAGLVALVMAVHEEQYRFILERLHFKDEFSPSKPYKHVVETRSGIIAVGGVGGDDAIFGGGIYDGSFNLDPVPNQNNVRRVYMVPALHRAPKRVLVIGLASGSWTQVLANHPGVESIDAVEINPGYLDLIRRYPEHAPLLDNPRVRIHVDDGRRWLARNPEARFDFIVMNSTFHWRSHSTNLLSVEFFELCKRHLAPGGGVLVNPTDSEHVNYTLAQVFKHVVAVDNNTAGSDAPFTLSAEEKERALRAFTLHGQPAFSAARPRSEAVLRELVAMPLTDMGEALRARTDLWKVTEDNMAIEYKVHVRMVDPARSWGQLWSHVK